MFEKEAEEIMRQNGCRTHSGNFIQADKVCELIQKGAEFGYNKANEWHYVKDGDLPKDTTVLYLVRVYSWDFGFSHLYKKNGTYIPTVCEWNGEYFKALDSMAYSNARNIKSCFAWKEIVLPELKESE